MQHAPEFLVAERRHGTRPERGAQRLPLRATRGGRAVRVVELDLAGEESVEGLGVPLGAVHGGRRHGRATGVGRHGRVHRPHAPAVRERVVRVAIAEPVGIPVVGHVRCRALDEQHVGPIRRPCRLGVLAAHEVGVGAIGRGHVHAAAWRRGGVGETRAVGGPRRVVEAARGDDVSVVARAAGGAHVQMPDAVVGGDVGEPSLRRYGRPGFRVPVVGDSPFGTVGGARPQPAHRGEAANEEQAAVRSHCRLAIRRTVGEARRLAARCADDPERKAATAIGGEHHRVTARRPRRLAIDEGTARERFPPAVGAAHPEIAVARHGETAVGRVGGVSRAGGRRRISGGLEQHSEGENTGDHRHATPSRGARLKKLGSPSRAVNHAAVFRSAKRTRARAGP